ncbi:MAG: hypothetical protein J5927_04375 [Oscillospiraceae bacterium]|nr:hypothetical protein [Oscillospiraceae bacterium]
MKRYAKKQLFCLLMVLALCLSLPLFAVEASAAVPQALLVLADTSAMDAGTAGKLVTADKAVVDRVLENTTVCPETRDLLTKGDAVVTEAQLNHTGWGVRALATLDDGTQVPVVGHAVLEYRGEYLFGGENGFMLYGFQEENGKTRYYSPVSLQKFDLLDGRMPSDTTLYIADKFYAVDENGYIDVDNPLERDEHLWARYWRAEYCQGLPLHNYLSFNATLCKEHSYDFEHPTESKAPTATEEGYVVYVCPRCGDQITFGIPVKTAS